MFKNVKKIITFILLVCLLFYNSGPLTFVLAQEVTPTPADQQDTTTVQSSDSTQQTTQDTQTQATEPTPTPAETPSSDTITTSPEEVSATLTPTPTPTPSPIPYWSDEYDAMQVEQEILDNEMEVREEEWDTNEDNETWVTEHGGSESYYVSGQWQSDQEAAAAAAAEAAAQEQSVPASDSPESALQETDPFVSAQNATTSKCVNSTDALSEGSYTTSSDGTTDGSTVSSDYDSTNVSNDNCADISNNSDTGGISGENTQTSNDSSVNMNTGNASGDGILINQGNINTTDNSDMSSAESSAEDSFAQGSDAENVSTGEDSESLTSATEVDNLAVNNSNQAYIDNNMKVEGVSGSNLITDNDGDVQLTSGDIELLANMLNILNLNITGDDFLHLIVNIFGTLNGTLDLDDIAIALGFSDDDDLEVIARNEDTEDDSQNTANATKEENTDIDNSNYAEVNNEMNVSGVSGGNNVSGNDGGADVVTGRIKILANLMNFINANFSGEKWSFIMVNIFGALNGDIIVPGTGQFLNEPVEGVLAENVNPGEGSINNSSSSSVENTSTTNNNDVLLTNNINANGVSGNNQQNGNDDGDGEHTMQTGAVDVVTQLINFLNFNITGNNWVFLIINVFGTWMGKIVGFAGNGVMDAPSQGSFAALSVGGSGGANIIASNSATGEDSTNNASSSYASNIDVANQNQAVVTNTMNIEGISGENQVNQNDAGTSLTTGWIEIDANLLNVINMNVTGRNWLIVFLNVFGDFVGNLFFGPPPAPIVPENVSVMAASGVGGTNSSTESNNSSGNYASSQVNTMANSIDEELERAYTGDSSIIDSETQDAKDKVLSYRSSSGFSQENQVTDLDEDNIVVKFLKSRYISAKLWFSRLFNSLEFTWLLALEKLIKPAFANF